ncbi:MAG: Spy/CpxP family protein refolding chaperone [Burkholderiales bacterium]
MTSPDPGRSAFLRLSAGALALAAADEALAQFSGRRGAKDRPRREGEPDQPSAANRLADALGEFHEDLKLTNQQQPAWERYARAVESLQQDIVRERARAKTLDGMDLPQRLGHLVDVARDRYAATEDIAAAAKALYAALTPEQQPLANPSLAGIAEMVSGIGVPPERPRSAKRERGEREPTREEP